MVLKTPRLTSAPIVTLATDARSRHQASISPPVSLQPLRCLTNLPPQEQRTCRQTPSNGTIGLSWRLRISLLYWMWRTPSVYIFLQPSSTAPDKTNKWKAKEVKVGVGGNLDQCCGRAVAANTEEGWGALATDTLQIHLPPA